MKGRGQQKQFVRLREYTVKGKARLTRTLVFAGGFTDGKDKFFVFKEPRKEEPRRFKITIRRRGL